MANATGFGEEMIVSNLEEYENRAVALANSISYVSETGPDMIVVRVSAQFSVLYWASYFFFQGILVDG